MDPNSRTMYFRIQHTNELVIRPTGGWEGGIERRHSTDIAKLVRADVDPSLISVAAVRAIVEDCKLIEQARRPASRVVSCIMG